MSTDPLKATCPICKAKPGEHCLPNAPGFQHAPRMDAKPEQAPAPETETIDLTPTWAETANMLLAILTDGTPKGKEMARQEVRRMGTLLDHHAKVREKLAEYLKAQETDDGAEDHWLRREGLRELLRT